MTSYLTSIDTFYLVPFSRYTTTKFLGFDLWLLGVTWGQKYFHYLKAHVYDFLFNFFWHFLSISYRFRDTFLFLIAR